MGGVFCDDRGRFGLDSIRGIETSVSDKRKHSKM